MISGINSSNVIDTEDDLWLDVYRDPGIVRKPIHPGQTLNFDKSKYRCGSTEIDND